jgi:flagellar hook-basal body complex protein FliE
MKANIIDAGRIEAMLGQLKQAAARAQGMGDTSKVMPGELAGTAAPKSGFSDALKLSLDRVNGAQGTAEVLGKRFASGDNSVNLSDVMISMQKASIAFQATVQVRNKLVSAYQEMMNMQV